LKCMSIDFASISIPIIRQVDMTLPFGVLITRITRHARVPTNAKVTLGPDGHSPVNTSRLVACASDTPQRLHQLKHLHYPISR
jgi:hypothetical protein